MILGKYDRRRTIADQYHGPAEFKRIDLTPMLSENSTNLLQMRDALR